MGKRFSGFDFWEQRCKALQNSRVEESESQKRLSDASNTSDNGSTTDEPTSAETLAETPLALPPTIEATEQSFEPDPIVVRKVRCVRHRVSISVAPALSQRSQSASMSRDNEDQEIIPTTTASNHGDVALSLDTVDHSRIRSHSFQTKPPRPSLRIETGNLSTKTRVYQRQSMPPIPTFSETTINYITPIQPQKKASESPSDLAKNLSQEMDKAFDALTEELQDHQQITTKDAKHSPKIYHPWNPDVEKIIPPLRPKVAPQQPRHSGPIVRKPVYSSVGNHASSPMSPYLTIKQPNVAPLGYNLDYDLCDFLRWEAKNVSVFGVET
ncbi:hypothetical protein FALBO_2058 [Fusarium albosuccineum]|uniref:Uncharacterized protein n=1 Tax=Fusarium albosuccineum TaxID=1237068 RepID=A0A8H4LP66_9HYPO|nr:hypothetical protein FALBO_2058 [Fusarium albosuccineum]